MASKRDLRFYFVKTNNTIKETSSSNQKVSLVIQSSSNMTGETEIQYVQQEIKKEVVKPAKRYVKNSIKNKVRDWKSLNP